MSGIHNHYWCILPNIYEAPPKTDTLNIIFSEQDGYKTYSNCAGCRSYDKTPLVFVDGSSGAFTKTTVGDFEFDDLTDLPIADSEHFYQAGNIPRINAAKGDKMGRAVNLVAGRTGDDAKTHYGGPVDIPPPGKRAMFYNPMNNYGNLFNWLFYKYHEDVFCNLSDGRTFDNEIKLENNDRGNISYGRERVYLSDVFTDEEINEYGYRNAVHNKKQHTLMIQMDPRVIWNANRMTLDLSDNYARQYGEWPPKRTYYGGMGGVVGGTNTLSPISYAAANRSDYQKEAGTNFLPCCSRTDGSFSSTCPYPVHDFGFNFQEPVDRYPHFNDYIPGRSSFDGTVTISRSGYLPTKTQEWDDLDTDQNQELRPPEENYWFDGILGDDGEYVSGYGPTWGSRYLTDVTPCCGPFSSKWLYQNDSTTSVAPCLTLKDVVESTMDVIVLSKPHEGYRDGSKYKFVSSWKPRESSFFKEGFMYACHPIYENFYNIYTFGGLYDNGCSDPAFEYGRIVKEVSVNEDDYYYNSTYVDLYPHKFSGEGSGIIKVPAYTNRFCDLPTNRGWNGSEGPGSLLWNYLYNRMPRPTGDNLQVPPEDLADFDDADMFSEVWDKNNLVYYNGPENIEDIELWRSMHSSGYLHGFTAEVYVTARTRFKPEVDLYERHPANSESFKEYEYTIGGEPPPDWDWGADTDPFTSLKDWLPDATGYCYTWGDALYNEYGQNINGGDPTNLTIGSCCWTDTRPESLYYGRKFCFDPWYMNLGTPLNEGWSGFYTQQGFFDPYTANRIFFAKAVCDCIGKRPNVDANWYPNTTCMLNDGSMDDAFPSYYEDYMGLGRGTIVSWFGTGNLDVPANPYSYARYGIGDVDELGIIYQPSPCGGQHKVWPCDHRGPIWHPRYLYKHFPGPTIMTYSGSISGSRLSGYDYEINTFTQGYVPDGANTWPDPRVNDFFTQFGSGGTNLRVNGLSPFQTDAAVYCLKIPKDYGVYEETMPGVTLPYVIEVSAGDFPWEECAWPWSRHSYSNYDFPGGCNYYSALEDLFDIGGYRPRGARTEEQLRHFPDDPLHQRRMLERAGYDGYADTGENAPNDREALLSAIDAKCPGYKEHYYANRPSFSTGLGGPNSWKQGVYVDLETGYNDVGYPNGEAPLIKPTVPSIGLGNYSPHPSINAGRLEDLDYTATPKKRIRFQTWSRWREWVPWTNFTPIIMNHLERWIMPGRTQNLKKVSIYLPKGIHAFGRNSMTSLGDSDVYFPESITNYTFPLRGTNSGCLTWYGDDAVENPFVIDAVPGHLRLDVSGTGSDGVPDFPYGFDLSGTRKTLNYLLRKINPEIEIEWVLYPERVVSPIWGSESGYATNRGTAQTNSGIFLGEVIYQTCAYGYHVDEYGNTIWNDTTEECLDFLDPHRICTDGYNIMYPYGFEWSLENLNYYDTPYWQGYNNPDSEWYVPRVQRSYGIAFVGPGIRYYTNLLMPWGSSGWNVERAEWMTEELSNKLKKYPFFTNDGINDLFSSSILSRKIYLMTRALGDHAMWKQPCLSSGYRPPMTVLEDKLYELYPDFFTDVFDLTPHLRPLRTFNTRKYLTGYYDIINHETELVDLEGKSLGTVKERFIKATGPPPLDERYEIDDEGNPQLPTTQDLVDKVKHPDFGWGVDGDREIVRTGVMDTTPDDKDWSDLSWRDVLEYYFYGAFYNPSANPSQNIDAFLQELKAFGMDLNSSVFSNNCGLNDGNLGCFLTVPDYPICDSCNPTQDTHGDCYFIDENGDEQVVEWLQPGDCNYNWLCENLGYCDTGGHSYVPYSDDDDTGCCEGEWTTFYGNVPVWNFEDDATRTEIEQGPDFGPGYDAVNAYPSFWDTLNYSCMSFGCGVMHWASEKSNYTLDLNDPWFTKYMFVVMEFIWSSNAVQGMGGSNGIVSDDSPWLAKNGGFLPFDGGDFFDAIISSQFFADEFSAGAQMTYSDSYYYCQQTRDRASLVAGGLACNAEEIKPPQFSSTHWHPERRIIELYDSETGLSDRIDPYIAIPTVAYPEVLQAYRDKGRQLLPEALIAITKRSKGGYEDYGFGPLQSEIEGHPERNNILDGQYGIVNAFGSERVDNIGSILDGINFDLERFDPENPDGKVTNMCGPVDAPYPCILRFVRPNTDVWWTDLHGQTMTHQGGRYEPLKSISPRGVGKPVEMVKGFNGHGSYNNHGHGNTFDFRYSYDVKRPDDNQEYDWWMDRVKMVHHSGKELPVNIKEINQTGQGIQDYGNGRD